MGSFLSKRKIVTNYSRIFFVAFVVVGRRGDKMKSSPPVGIQRYIIMEAGSLNGIS
jgi:hypothetical protein